MNSPATLLVLIRAIFAHDAPRIADNACIRLDPEETFGSASAHLNRFFLMGAPRGASPPPDPPFN